MGYLPYRRTDRLMTLFREEISEIIMRRVKDPRVRDVTVTWVEVKEDLSSAVVHFYVRDESRKEEVQKGLESASRYIRHVLLKTLSIKRVPELSFEFDPLYVTVEEDEER